MTELREQVGINLQPIELSPPAPVAGPRWRIHVYAHTHWDREWYRTFERFRMQLVGVVDRILHALDSDPAFTTFVLDGQTIVLEDYLAIRPEEEPRIRRLVGAGRIEVGPWHVLPDEFLVSGESLVRNLHEGRRVASRFGDPLAVGYLPDPFGHVAQLPAVLRGFGIDNVIFSRGMGDQHARTGSEFRWESLDGATSVLALVQGSPYTSGYCNAELVGRGNGPGDLEGYDRIAELAPYLAERARTDSMLLAAGCDHETVQAELPAVVRAIEDLLPGCEVRITGLDAFVASVRESEERLVGAGGELERWRGELRGSLHAPILASIFSARVHLKQDNDRAQALLERHVEPLMATAVVAGVRSLRDVAPFLRHAWRLVLENHPHDSIGGCSVDEVHLEMPARTLRAVETCHSLLEDLRIVLGLGDEAVVHDAEGLGGIAERADGSPVAIEPARPGRLVPLADVVAPDAGVEVGDSHVAAGGTTVRVVDGVLQVERDGRTVDLTWVDEADAGDEYDFGAIPGDAPITAPAVATGSREAGPGVAELEVEHLLRVPRSIAADRERRSGDLVDLRVRTRVRVSAATPLAHLVVDLDNTACDHRLRLRATVDGLTASDTVEALGHFAVVERPVRPPRPASSWRQLPPGLDHCSGAVRAGGVLLAGRGIHEYEAHPGALDLTVLRSVGWLSRDDIAGRPGHAGPALATPGAQCLGPRRVELAVGVGEAAAFAQARAFLAPPLVLEPFGIGQSSSPAADPDVPYPLESGAMARVRDLRAASGDPLDARARIERFGLEVLADGAFVSACKLADDDSGDLVVRWWAPHAGDEARAELRLGEGVGVRDVQRARLDETPLGPAPLVDGRCSLRVPPGGIVTVRVRLGE